MMGGMDWAGSWFVCNGHYTSALLQNSKKIVPKYKPIAPKPSLLPSVSYESVSNSMSHNALNPHLCLKQSNGSERSNRKKRRAPDFYKSPSTRGRRRKRALCSPDYLGSMRSPIVETGSASIMADRPKIEHPLDGYFGVDRLNVVKDLGFMEKGSSSLGSRSVCGKESVVFGEEVQLNQEMDSMGEVVIQKQQEEDRNWRNLVTLPLLPQTSASKDSGSCASNSTSNCNSSYDKEKFRLRIFGKDFSN